MRIYIAGPISNNPNFMEQFGNAEKKLKKLGYEVINPATCNAEAAKTLPYEEIMQLCFVYVDWCDTIVLLPGWETSPGAVREFERAQEKRKFIQVYKEPII